MISFWSSNVVVSSVEACKLMLRRRCSCDHHPQVLQVRIIALLYDDLVDADGVAIFIVQMNRVLDHGLLLSEPSHHILVHLDHVELDDVELLLRRHCVGGGVRT